MKCSDFDLRPMTTSTIQITFFGGFSNVNYFAVRLRLKALMVIILGKSYVSHMPASSLFLQVNVHVNDTFSLYIRRSKFSFYFCRRSFFQHSIRHSLVDEFFMHILMVHEGECQQTNASPRVKFEASQLMKWNNIDFESIFDRCKCDWIQNLLRPLQLTITTVNSKIKKNVLKENAQ